jgi:hypothetical protein
MVMGTIAGSLSNRKMPLNEKIGFELNYTPKSNYYIQDNIPK